MASGEPSDLSSRFRRGPQLEPGPGARRRDSELLVATQDGSGEQVEVSSVGAASTDTPRSPNRRKVRSASARREGLVEHPAPDDHEPVGGQGLSPSPEWAHDPGVVGDRSGWALTALNSLGLVWTIAIMALAYTGATQLVARITARDWSAMSATFLPSLVPILLAYTLAHYFSLLVFEGQGAWALLSDPFGWRWDLFGTAGRAIDFTVLSAATIAYVQAGSIVVGHVVGVVAAHDRSVELFRPRLAERSQYPMLGVMVLHTVGGLGLLLGG